MLESITALQSGHVPERLGLSERVYRTLRDQILTGELAPGERVIEEALAKRLHVSRAPLREAILRLKEAGLLVDESPRMTRVIRLDLQTIRELQLVRVLLESVAYQQAAKAITSSQVERLEEVLNEMHSASEVHDLKAIAALDYRFHQLLCEASGLSHLTSLWERQQVLVRLWLNIVGYSLGDDEASIAERHEEILNAVLHGSPDEIFDAVHHHVYFIGDYLRTERRRWAAEQPRVTTA